MPRVEVVARQEISAPNGNSRGSVKEAKMATVDLGDVTIHYEEVGHGPTAFILCESDHMTWGPKAHDHRYPGGEHMIPELNHWKADIGRAIYWEYRGKGESSEPAKYSLPLAASDLARMIDKLGVTKPVVYGLEWGGVLAQEYALDYPEQCAALVLDSASPELNEAASEPWYKQAYSRLEDPVSFPERPKYSKFVCRVFGSMYERPMTPRLHNIKSPTFILAGAKDTATRGAGGSVIMSRQIQGSQLKIFDEGGHGLIRERPREVQPLVIEFLRKHGII